MATRSITSVTSNWEDKDEVSHHVTIYRHFDGYPSNQGMFLADILDSVVISNGREDHVLNGPGELASYIVSKMFDAGHNPHLVEKNSVMGQEYHYNIHVQYGRDGGTIEVRAMTGPMTFFGGGGEHCTEEEFRGSVVDFSLWCDRYDIDEDDD